MAEEDFTSGEMLRALQAITGTQQAMTAEIKELRAEIGRTYVPRGEWVEARKGDGRRMAAVEADVDTLQKSREGDQSWRRTSSLTLQSLPSGGFSRSSHWYSWWC